MSRLSRSWHLVKASAAVLRADKELIVFPLLAGGSALIVTAAFGLALWLNGAYHQLVQGRQLSPLGWLILFLFYLATNVVVTYFNAALVGTALLRLDGKNSRAGDGFRLASRRFGAILGYAVIAATVGVLLTLIRNRGQTFGRAVASVGGLAWSIATYLVVPVLVSENRGPIDAIQRSSTMLKRTWGEQIAGTIGMGAVFGLIILVSLLISVPLAMLALSAQLVSAALALVTIDLLLLVLISVVSGALRGIYTAALYRYATGSGPDGWFDADLVRGAFLTRQAQRFA